MKTRVVELDGVRVTARRQTYGDRYTYGALLNAFKGFDGDEQQSALRTNFCFASAHSVDFSGAEFELPSATDDAATLERKFAQFLALDADFVDAWLDAVVSLNRREQADPNAEAPAT